MGEWLEEAVAAFCARCVPEARVNAELIMAHILRTGRNEVRLNSQRRLTPIQSSLFQRLVGLRGRRIPLAYVLGCQPFMDLNIEVDDSVLIPRPETEELTLEAAELFTTRKQEALEILEIGTGSGCVSIALSRLLPNAVIEATDISPAALVLARKNAGICGRSPYIWFNEQDLFSPWPQKNIDLVISNPPYIPTPDLELLEAEVRKEPFLALDGGADGLAAIRAIIKEAPNVLKPTGALVLEIGSNQESAVKSLLAQRGFLKPLIRKDLQDRDRIVIAKMID
ncbi:MAG: protein-(glutamine-N5) methyltransferase, release factor-specific [Elusimicrobia bacterium RIFCSPHIGHO2_02_FULL_57_9]|nr:MAG: protein-(glutamine-N5) methyltransferase, release factor-specific [Elusimicrobia bacterium RIFCSPHIGHO2_02_FULL_57_9]